MLEHIYEQWGNNHFLNIRRKRHKIHAKTTVYTWKKNAEWTTSVITTRRSIKKGIHQAPLLPKVNNGTPRNKPQERMAYTTCVMYTIWHSPKNKCAIRIGACSINLPIMRQIRTSRIRYDTIRGGGGGGVKAWLYQVIVFKCSTRGKSRKSLEFFTHFQVKQTFN